ncbi:enoyl-CoA hydratase/delta3,5-delta2,4-dienoyl-CoA isomerase (macronuclear) [Tetrahymena thermophila SB210]|uniref:Enoyl-CoA hydratase/delta3,5-delta2,4-dienoyl-CoA isomerase n=1 Tax=Tetrahymena thermophila (strain SB210) TaxID=312017 RepID=Q23NK1_TETTS|nr:enoyl-CoA hydratase/delta3,5-delta2,4-dienoyl-CoA isomerase [Tetrahymena thermophila SB210]EAR98073.1 enoyl-CoA hydratase/delta3,5-delta2,4-dienoyl-CoA isomerase [Tetrahymena thermophila SB210]|eukprot:XP_001018318.1 enoyl-CoA hydratase/delta3,5-delta2,4-dienoyl-CoA isomerase [Tetrahymena thermophila SB210]
MELNPQKLKEEALQEQSVLKEISEEGILTITLNKPKKFNSLTIGMYYVIIDYLNEANSDSKVKTIILRGNGKNFSSGNDLSNFVSFAGDREFQIKGSQFFGNDLMKVFCAAFINCKKPIIAVVQGSVIGVAFTLLMLCDEIYSTEDAYFQAPLVKLAQGPEMCSSYTFPQVFGYQRAFEIIVGAKTLKSRDMLDYKVVNQLFKTYEETLQYAQQRAKEFCQLDQESVIQAKSLMRWDRDILHKVNLEECKNLINRWSSENLIEVIMNFFQRKQNSKL